jgi:hypothetical protein
MNLGFTFQNVARYFLRSTARPHVANPGIHFNRLSLYSNLTNNRASLKKSFLGIYDNEAGLLVTRRSGPTLRAAPSTFACADNLPINPKLNIRNPKSQIEHPKSEIKFLKSHI